MAYLISYLEGNYNRKQFLGADETDLPPIVDKISIAPASEVIIPTKGVRYILNSKFEWQSAPYSYGSSGGGGSTPSGDTYTNATPTNQSVGGIKSGQSFNNETWLQIVERIFYPLQVPTLTNPSSTITLLSDEYVEVGDPVDVKIRSNFSQGSISPAYHGGPTVRSGPAITYAYSGGGLGTYNNTDAVDNQTIVGYVTDKPTILAVSCFVNYSAGEQPLDSDGNPYSSPLSAGKTSTKSVTVESVYPIFANTADINVMRKQPLSSAKNFTLSFVGESDTIKQSFETEATFGELTGVKAYNVISKEWQYLGGSAAASLLQFTKTTISRTVAAGEKAYIKYAHNMGKIGARELELQFS